MPVASERLSAPPLMPREPAQADASAPSLPVSRPECVRLSGRVGDLLAHAPHSCHSLGLATPVDFPLQGSGDESEFDIAPPIWSRQPFTTLYLVYLGLSLLLVRVPVWAIDCIAQSRRGHISWSWSRAILVRIGRCASKATFRTHLNLGRDLSQAVPHVATKHSRFAWIPQVPSSLMRGELDPTRFAEQGMHWEDKVPGFWFGEQGLTRARPTLAPHRDQPDSISSPLPPFSEDCGEGAESFAAAEEDEQVLLHFHGGAYWLGTAHERDFTSKVTHETLGALQRLYKGSRGRCRRSFSLDYRLCMPNRPDLGSWPAPLLDGLAGYLYLVRDMGFQPRNVILVGDSAGGNLALALCRYLRDEGIAEVPGRYVSSPCSGKPLTCFRLLLLAPWADVSRSHAGPLHAENAFSSAVRNRDSDIIPPSKEYRNTCVSTLLGKFPARQAYTNPYLSPASLQLPLANGGAGPHYGFQGFPQKVLITTGTAEMSYDSHITLAHRMAMGTKSQHPIYTGGQCCSSLDSVQLASRPSYPRPAWAEVDLTPSPCLSRKQGEERLSPLLPSLLTDRSYTSATKVSEAQATPSSSRASLFLSEDWASNGLEEREVILYEAIGGVHEYPLISFWEPDRTRTWDEIARWIDSD